MARSRRKQQKSTLEMRLRYDGRYCFDDFSHAHFPLGETFPIMDLLFTKQRNFLIKNDGQQVTKNDLKGKTIIVYMLSLKEPSLLSDTADMIEVYNALWPMGGFELVFVPKGRVESSDIVFRENRFNDLFSKMPWPAVPFGDKQTCERIENKLCILERQCDEPHWALIDPAGKIFFTRVRKLRSLFGLYEGADLFPLSERRLLKMLCYDEDEAIKGIINLNQLLSSPARDFLLAKDGNKVPISSLKDKVVGLYFCDNIPNPPRMEAIKKIYGEAIKLGYDFEIVQITFYFRNQQKYIHYAEDLPLQLCFENVPWLTLPFKDSRCRTLRRLFKLHKKQRRWRGDSLVIVDPRQPNTTGAFFEYHGANIVEDFGIKAYPFTQRKVFEMKEKINKELRLQVIFPPCGPPLIRPRSFGGYDRVPASQIWGKQVLIVFATHSNYESSEFVSNLVSKYTSQQRDSELEFEVVYVSYDEDSSKFDECIKEMPWLVHPYSWDFAEKWRSILFKNGAEASIVAFNANGELIVRQSCLKYDHTMQKYPFFMDDIGRYDHKFDFAKLYIEIIDD